MVGGYYSPHVTGWAERIRVAGEEADFEAAVERVRPAAEAPRGDPVRGADGRCASRVRRVRRGRCRSRGRPRRTPRRDERPSLTRPGPHELSRWSTRTSSARRVRRLRPRSLQSSSRVRPSSSARREWEELALANGAGSVIVETGGNRAVGGAAASAFLGRPVSGAEVVLPGRLEHREDEIRDGAHTPDALRHIAPELPALGSIVASILADKDVTGMLSILARHADTFVATTSSHPNALPAEELARMAEGSFRRLESVNDPEAALARAHQLGRPVLVTGSLYLLADLAAAERQSCVP